MDGIPSETPAATVVDEVRVVELVVEVDEGVGVGVGEGRDPGKGVIVTVDTFQYAQKTQVLVSSVTQHHLNIKLLGLVLLLL